MFKVNNKNTRTTKSTNTRSTNTCKRCEQKAAITCTQTNEMLKLTIVEM